MRTSLSKMEVCGYPRPKDLRSFLSSNLPYNFNNNNKQKDILIAEVVVQDSKLLVAQK